MNFIFASQLRKRTYHIEIFLGKKIRMEIFGNIEIFVDVLFMDSDVKLNDIFE